MLLASALLGGCVNHGDFGRIEPSLVHQRLGLNPYGSVPGFTGNHDRTLPLTDAEREMRAHAYALTFTYAHEPTHGHWSQYDPIVPDMQLMDRFPDAKRYVRQMVNGGYRSPEAMMNAIVDDIRADLDHLDAFQPAAQTVYADDGQRLAELESFGTSVAATERDMAKRIADNRFVIEHAMVALSEKIAGYESAMTDVLLAGGQQARTAAFLELEGIKRRSARLEADLRRTDARYALTVPREPRCLDASIARPC